MKKHIFFFKSFVLSIFVTATLVTAAFGMEDNAQPPAEHQGQNRLDEDVCYICWERDVNLITTCNEMPQGADNFGRKLLRFFTLGYCGKRRVTLIEHPHRFCRTCLRKLFMSDAHGVGTYKCPLCRKNINDFLPQLTDLPIRDIIIKRAMPDFISLMLRLALLCTNAFVIKGAWKLRTENFFGCLIVLMGITALNYVYIFGTPKTDDRSLFSLMKNMKTHWAFLKAALNRWWTHRHQANPDRAQ